ncbi:copper resistance protein CopC [Xylanimonas oleitrophica]|uniref:Copper resistance protein CopC n=2 Tax=Xylanimonas oleitrophica TaxID=2607479 RepID=A0A2W5XTU3_9MICO|nr:copper resistance protein CopC [Xylanimonas oleitrophica]
MLVSTFAGAVIMAAPASAHDRLLSSDPADGATLDAAPASVTLTYSAELLPTGAQVVVTADGTDVGVTDVQVAGTDVVAALPAGLPAGAYEVAWRVVSSDGHPIDGTTTFTLTAQAEPAPPAEAATASPEPEAAAASSETEPSPAGTAGTDDGEHAEHDGTGLSGWTAGLIALAVVGGVVALIAARRRAQHGFGPPGQD